MDEIFADQSWGESLRQQVREELRIHYNGYRFLPGSPTLYNSTICNYYLKDLVLSRGKIPRDHIDVNLNVDINWLRRLGGARPPANWWTDSCTKGLYRPT